MERSTNRQAFPYRPETSPLAVVITALPCAFGIVMAIIDARELVRAPLEHLALLAVFISPFIIAVLLRARRLSLAGQITRGEVELGLFLEETKLRYLLPGDPPLERSRGSLRAVSTVQRRYGKGRRGPDTVVIVSTEGDLEIDTDELHVDPTTLHSALDRWRS